MIDWPGLLRFALANLGLRPAEFWDLTPAEFLLIAGLSPGSSAAMTRRELNELIARFPDQSGENHE